MLKLLMLVANIFSMVICMESENILDALKIGSFSIGSGASKNRPEEPILDELKRIIQGKKSEDAIPFNYYPFGQQLISNSQGEEQKTEIQNNDDEIQTNADSDNNRSDENNDQVDEVASQKNENEADSSEKKVIFKKQVIDEDVQDNSKEEQKKEETLQSEKENEQNVDKSQGDEDVIKNKMSNEVKDDNKRQALNDDKSKVDEPNFDQEKKEDEKEVVKEKIDEVDAPDEYIEADEIVQQQFKEEERVNEYEQDGNQLMNDIVKMPQWDIDDQVQQSSTSIDPNINNGVIDPIFYVTPTKKPTEWYDHATAKAIDSVNDQSIYLDSSFESEAVLDHTFEESELSDVSEYGFGMWVRYLSTYPEKHVHDPNLFYFICRLTQNRGYKDFNKFGDRTLGIWLLRNIFIFTTYDLETKEKNLDKNIIKVGVDLETRWYFLEFSHSTKKNITQGFVSRGSESTTQGVTIKCTHIPIKYLRLIVGGQHLFYNGFNGQIANLYYGVGKGLFIPSSKILLNHIISKISQMPQNIRQLTQIQAIKDIQVFDANEPQINMIRTEDSQKMAEEYAISGWLRWLPNILVEEITTFLIFNLRQNKDKSDKENASLGDRDLEIVFAFGAQEEGSYYYNTYSTLGNNGHGNPFLTQRVQSKNYIWSFIYFGYKQQILETYGSFIQPSQANEIKHYDIIHKLAPIMYLYVGAEKKSNCFNGIMALFNLYLGPGSFRRGLTFGYTFNFDIGTEKFFTLNQPIQLSTEEIKSIAYDQTDSIVYSISHNDKKNKISGASEYSFGVWSRWLRTAPKYLITKSPQHLLGRVATLQKYKDNEHLRDRTLLVYLGEGNYEFITYDRSKNTRNNLIQKIPYLSNQLEGKWNYVFFGYKRTSNQTGQADGFVYFSDNGQILKVHFNCYHLLIINYITYTLRSEFGVPLFNGYLNKLTFRVGVGAHITNEEILQKYANDLFQPQPEIIKRKTIILISGQIDLTETPKQEGEQKEQEQEEEEQTINTNLDQDNPIERVENEPQENDEETQDQTMLTQVGEGNNDYQDSDDKPEIEGQAQKTFTDFEGSQEYSLSGWVRWSYQKEKTGLNHQIIGMAQRRAEDTFSEEIVGENTLAILRSDGVYKFFTYTCKEGESQCNTGLVNEQSYLSYWDEWTYIYFGYSENIKKCHGYLRFTFRDSHFDIEQVVHFYCKFIYFFFFINRARRNDQNQFLGLMKSWVLNIGEGSYTTQLEDDNQETHFGMQSGYDHVRTEPIGWQPSQPNSLLECSADQSLVPLQVELGSQQIQGVIEYGYGYWSRFLYEGPKARLITKPQWLGLSRLTVNKQFHDMQDLGDRVLCIWLAKGFYHFGTYNLDPPNPSVSASIPYPVDVEGTWVYIYFSYRRFAESEGKAIGYLKINGGVQEIELNQQVIHIPLNEYLLFMVGNAGPNYKSFNGYITNIKLNLGPGAYIFQKDDFNNYQTSFFPEPQIPQSKLQILTINIDPLEYPEAQPPALEIKDLGFQYKESQQYAVHMWFRPYYTRNPAPQVVFRLSQNDQSQMKDFQNPGDRTLNTQLNNQVIVFSTYTLTSNDNFRSPLQQECSINEESQYLWTYVYAAYNHRNQEVNYFIQADKHQCQKNDKVLHRTSNYFAFYVGFDGYTKQLFGKIANTYLAFGDGVYLTERLQTQSMYVNGLNTLFMSKLFVWDTRKEERFLVDSQSIEPVMKQKFTHKENHIDSIIEYSYGFWCRFLIAIPNRIINTHISRKISSFNSKHHESQKDNIIFDRILGINLITGSYQYQTYDTKTNNPSLQTQIQYSEIEGIWNYLYIGYRRYDRIVQCYLMKSHSLSGSDDINLQAKMSNVLHFPLGEYAEISIGGQQQGNQAQSFQGYVAQISVRLGPKSLITEIEVLRQMIDMYYNYEMSSILIYKYHKKQPEKIYEEPEDENQIRISDQSESEPDQNQEEEQEQDIQQFEPQFISKRLIIISDIVYIDYTSNADEIEQKQQQQDQEPIEILDELGEEETQVINIEKVADESEDQKQQDTEEEPLIEAQLKQINENKDIEKSDEPEGEEQQQKEEQQIHQKNKNYILQSKDWIESPEYSVSGWFKWHHNLYDVEDCYSLMRLTNNEKSYRSDQGLPGDRTLLAQVCKPYIRAHTYTLLSNEIENLMNVRHLHYEAQMNEYILSWNYIYIAYSSTLRTVHLLVKRPDSAYFWPFYGVKHIIPNYICLYVGSDPFLPNFNGFLQYWSFWVGEASFFNLENSQNLDNLPGIHSVQLNYPYQWTDHSQGNTEVKFSPGLSLETQFTQQAEAPLEYGFGIWVRWLHSFPDTLEQRLSLHTIARLSTKHHYQDSVEAGDRVLAAFVGLGRWVFATYDIQNLNEDQSIPINQQLEGKWYFVSFSYKRKTSEAVGYIFNNKNAKSIHLHVRHELMTGYCKFIVAERKFGYAPFHGMILDPRISFGEGAFVQSETDLIERVVVQHQTPQIFSSNSYTWRPKWKKLDTSNPDNEEIIYLEEFPNQGTEVNEYALMGWFKHEAISTQDVQQMVLMRLSTNKIIHEDSEIGDRTLLVSTTLENIIFDTYALNEPRFEKISTKMNPCQDDIYNWIYVYYAHSQIEQNNFIYMQYPEKSENENQNGIYHVVPKYFSLQILKDNLLNQFQGKIQGLKLMLGTGSYTLAPSDLINDWPYVPKQDSSTLMQVLSVNKCNSMVKNQIIMQSQQ